MPNKLPRYLIAVLAVIVAIAVAFFVYQLVLFGIVSANLPKNGDRVTFLEDGIGRRYEVKNNSLTRVSSDARPDGILVYEEVASPISQGERVVLAGIPDTDGLTAGIIRTDGSFVPLVGGSTDKGGLVVRSDGLAIFSMTPAAAVSLPGTQTEVGGEDAVVEVGSATGPVAFGNTTATQAPKLVAVNITSGAISMLGQGRSPRLQEDGSIIALAPEGVVRIDPVSGARAMVLERQGADAHLSALSPSGAVAALISADQSSMDFFALGESPVALGFTEVGPAYSASFFDDERIFFRTSADVARLFKLPSGKLQVATPVAIMSITE